MTRSEIMSRIKSRDTKPELRMLSLLRRRGLRPKTQDRLRPGRPDFSFPRERVAVFVDGRFWHGGRAFPKTNRAFWLPKLRETMRRDRRNDWALRAMGWSVVRIWEDDDLPLAADDVAYEVVVRRAIAGRAA